MISLATTLPQNSNDGYVAAAYIVFFALILIYVVIMAVRLSRVEQRLRELQEHRTDEGGEREDEDRERELV
jgi:CcmD family protein